MLFAGALVAYQLSRALVIGDATDARQARLGDHRLREGLRDLFESNVQGWMLDNLHLTEFLNHFYVWRTSGHGRILRVALPKATRGVPTRAQRILPGQRMALAVFVVVPWPRRA